MTEMTTAAPPLDVRLRRLLADRRRSGRWLATEAGLNPSLVSRVLRGEREFTLSEADAAAAALQMSLVELLEGVDVAAAAPTAARRVSLRTQSVAAGVPA